MYFNIIVPSRLRCCRFSFFGILGRTFGNFSPLLSSCYILHKSASPSYERRRWQHCKHTTTSPISLPCLTARKKHLNPSSSKLHWTFHPLRNNRNKHVCFAVFYSEACETTN